MIKKYLKPKSLTWWAAIVPLVSGAVQLIGIDIPYVSAPVRALIVEVYGNVTPAALINIGLAGIGLRGAFDKLDVRT